MEISLARYNFFISLELLKTLVAKGMKHIILCPGSRSGPLALAAASLYKKKELILITSIDERSAAFLALGISAASGQVTCVITTSGTAVANLLPAAVEADRSCHPLLFLTADRPLRLKECGANQAVNQEDFLKSVCRHYDETPREGIHLISRERLNSLVGKSFEMAKNIPGPVHINLPYEEPLHPCVLDQKEVINGWEIDGFSTKKITSSSGDFLSNVSSLKLPRLDPFSLGIIIVGPWRGKAKQLDSFRNALKKWQKLSGWPILADPLSGVENNQEGLIKHWNLILSTSLFETVKQIQVLRLGPLPPSRELQFWLEKPGKIQLLITEGDYRNLDPIGGSTQFSEGFSYWVNKSIGSISTLPKTNKNIISEKFTSELIKYDLFINNWLDKRLLRKAIITEPALARLLPRLLPKSIPVMLASSSPIRDWLNYSGEGAFLRRCFGFRGASGIDGTLSMGMGLSIIMGRMILVTGDLALLHDTNGWLFSKDRNISLIVIMIDNGGGGIFNQLNIDQVEEGDFKEIFLMPQQVCPLTLAKAYGVKYKQVACIDDLEQAIEWSFSLSTNALIRVCTNSIEDHKLRVSLRNDLKKRLPENLLSFD
ncbi:2-succinyl-5-enolpyruvyl-6-hydroxy-3-cyclohexene-1-carboxylic-acid synthase [Prochlorococcus marinus]|uniref:2-succinyl-5-enolpyruvyl-6-hydroxy-3-cyclohexene-1-carboxylate synthase n=1 Tax=Prochlorococcus marinus XMU1408 TaxID=2213228 RepID=A0A318R4J0_PROMR|nr:2-succinyl-5-enolpyruvyl-6-hydroxy-3-cyclohexene-1-carboxylic-acid synthase [Prochlorococcus marinus]MBW3041633.1 2-succinyl-5-enolpyruvyl-6-hydroxy-3-cyclohexene-1-carboxylic-acid synthase [Prochlorococcus marinus str. XMU1408]PYE02788.1 2-succinyl-5-enolpyruvyl-6-hydroxy-3-cyclohexene-1-carboxylic-acid synthase [Prochlorococcus marinus XMU1408]